MEQTIYDVIVVGGGIVGLASAYKINLYHPQLKVLVLEKEHAVAMHQTGRNSGVIHSGIYYKPGSYKAKNCVEGRREIVQFAREHNIGHDVCGKIIVATHPNELQHLDRVYDNGVKNGVEDIEKITPEQIREIEPFCTGIAGLRVGCTGIIDFVGVCNVLQQMIEQKFNGSKVLTGNTVTGFDKQDDQINVITDKEILKVNTAFGPHSVG